MKRIQMSWSLVPFFFMSYHPSIPSPIFGYVTAATPWSVQASCQGSIGILALMYVVHGWHPYQKKPVNCKSEWCFPSLAARTGPITENQICSASSYIIITCNLNSEIKVELGIVLILGMELSPGHPEWAALPWLCLQQTCHWQHYRRKDDTVDSA